MRIIVAALIVISLSGCAARVFQVPLSPPDTADARFNVIVKDGRLDKQIYMTSIDFVSQSHIYLLTAEPPLEIALERYVLSATAQLTQRLQFTKAEVTIDELDLKDKVGFYKADELLCKIESSVVLYSDAAKPLERKVKTFTKNVENMSPFIVTAAKVILDQCLQKHAVELVDFMDKAK